ncbi:cytochrome c oxidase assembly factor 8 [Periplaneta americana]|uniref:cytochrome c oxidase assembly factor 8 n=1 Tax=Periplaneta americana TaxID=6978 RepID=UPI0037E94027
MATTMNNCRWKTLTDGIMRMYCRRVCGTDVSSKSVASKPTTHDLIGPPDSISNLRPIVFYKPKNEHPIEKQFRERRIEVQKWNVAFWTKHNQSFIKERKEFISAHLPQETLSDEKQTLTADEMSVFYKKFLDKNWNVHFYYNVEWYKKNFGLVLLELRVKILRLKQWCMSNSR